MFESGKDSPYLARFTSANGEDRRTWSSHVVVVRYNCGHSLGPQHHYGPPSHDVGTCQLCMPVSILLPAPATSSRVIGVGWCSQDSSAISLHLDYCNSLLYGTSDILFWRLQDVQNAAARLVTGTRRCDHPGLAATTVWLPVWQKVEFQLAILVCKALDNMAPPYLSDECQLIATTECHQLWSSDNHYHWYQFMPWRSSICCCWTTPLEKSSYTCPSTWFVLGHLPSQTENVFHCLRHQPLASVAFRRCVQIFLLTYLYPGQMD